MRLRTPAWLFLPAALAVLAGCGPSEASLIALLDSGAVAPMAPSASTAHSASGARHARADEMLSTSNDGRWGYLLKEVGGAVAFSAGVDEAFEPASALKVIYLFHALRALDAGEVSLRTPIPWYRASTVADDPATPDEDEREWGCPVDRDPAVGELGQGLRLMMERSDNRWTEAVRAYFGLERIRRTARETGMARTVLRHRIGCATGTAVDPGQTEAPNSSTLSELCGLMESVSAGAVLSAASTGLFLDFMSNDPLIRMKAIIADEGSAVGLPPALLDAIERRQELAWKSGKYNIADYKCQCVVGIARLVSCVDDGLRSRLYVFGVFVDDAHVFPEQGTRATLYSLAVASELLRDQVREVLRSYRAALGPRFRPVPGTGS